MHKKAGVSIVFGALSLAGANTHAVSLSYPQMINAIGDSPRYIVSGDLDRFHQTDLVVSNYVGDSIAILTSNGLGGYNTITLTTNEGVGDGPFSAAIGDTTGDIYADIIAVANFDDNSVSVFKKREGGAFSALAGSPIMLGSADARPHGLDVADIDGDSDLDIVTANLATNSVTVLLGDGEENFVLSTNLPVGATPYQVRAADLDNDGDQDLVVPNRDDNTVTVLLNDGMGTLTASAGSPFVVGEGPRFVEVAQVVGNLNPDIVVANTDGNSVTILTGNGTGGFSESLGSPVSVGERPNSVALGDIDGDGDTDIVTTDEARAQDGEDTISVLINNGLGEFTRLALPPSGERVYGSVLTDLDGDGDNDIAQVNADDDNLGIYWNVGAGAPPVALPDGPGGSYSTFQDTPLLINAPGVLSNDNDPESAILFAVDHTQPLNGELSNYSASGGSFTYRPNLGFTGTDTFNYTVHDGSQNGNTVTVVITVTP